MTLPGTIVVVDDNKGVLTALQMLLKDRFRKIVLLSSPASLTATIREEKPDVLLLDMNFSLGVNNGQEGLLWVQAIIGGIRTYPSC